jgi:hypothetical protein
LERFKKVVVAPVATTGAENVWQYQQHWCLVENFFSEIFLLQEIFVIFHIGGYCYS